MKIIRNIQVGPAGEDTLPLQGCLTRAAPACRHRRQLMAAQPACCCMLLRQESKPQWNLRQTWQGVSCLRRTSQAVCRVSTLVLSVQKYRDAAMIELEALNTLAANDPAQECHCVQLLEWFDYR